MQRLLYASSMELHPGERSAQRAAQGRDGEVFIRKRHAAVKVENE